MLRAFNLRRSPIDGTAVVNVRWHGAAGDGTTDDTAALTAAHTAASALRAPLYFPPGTYATTGNIISSASNCPGMFSDGDATITGYQMGSTTNAVSISSISKDADAIVTTATPHGMTGSKYVKISGITGMTELTDNQWYIATVTGASTYTIPDDTTGYSTYTGGATSAVSNGTNPGTYLLSIYKSNFYVDRIKFVGPIHTDYTILAPLSKLLYFEATSDPTEESRVSNCHFVGGTTACQFSGVGNGNVWFTDNLVTDSWADAAVFHIFKNAVVTGNQFERCCYTFHAGGVMHFSTHFQTEVAENAVIAHNIIKDCFLNGTPIFRQEAIDFSGLYVRNLAVQSNVFDNIYGGCLEFKFEDGTPPNFYGDYLVANNIFNLRVTPALTIASISQAPDGEVETDEEHGYTTGDTAWIANCAGMTQINNRTVAVTVTSPTKFTTGVNTSGFGAYSGSGTVTTSSGIGIAMNNNGEADDAMRMRITGNYFIADSQSASTAVTLSAWSNVDIDNNVILNMGVGLLATAAAETGTDQTTNLRIRNNVIDVYLQGLSLGTNTFTNVFIDQNWIRSSGDQAIEILTGTFNNLRCRRNHLETTATSTPVVYLKNIQGGGFSDNTVIGSHVGMEIVSGSTSTSLRIYRNDFQCVFAAIVANGVNATVLLFDNTTNCGNASRIWTTTGTAPTAWNNRRTPVTADPSATVAGSVGDIAPNSAVTSGGYIGWICTTAGNAGAATWKGYGAIA